MQSIQREVKSTAKRQINWRGSMGKQRASKKYQELRDVIIEKFSNPEKPLSNDYVTGFKFLDNINHLVGKCCCPDETIDFDRNNPATVLYQILRITKNPVIFRELEELFELIYSRNAKNALVEGFAILYSVDLVDYTIRNGYEGFSNSLLIFIKEDEDKKGALNDNYSQR
jgi:hypothetical protein